MENDVEGNVKDDWLLLRVTLVTSTLRSAADETGAEGSRIMLEATLVPAVTANMIFIPFVVFSAEEQGEH